MSTLHVKRNVAHYERHYRTGYKVLALLDTGELWSVAYVERYRALTYAIGQWTQRRAEFGPLAVFKSAKAASHFLALRVPSCVVARCYYVPSFDQNLWYPVKGRKLAPYGLLPPGTDFADRLIPTHLIRPGGEVIDYPQPICTFDALNRRYAGRPLDWTQVRTQPLVQPDNGAYCGREATV